MNAKYKLMAAMLGFSGIAAAQEVDDMYFNARDRVLHSEAARAEMAMLYAASDKEAVKSNPVNPSDTYTGRGVNPEYSAQQKNGAEIVQEAPDYYLASYQPKDINSNQYIGSSSCTASRNYWMQPGSPYAMGSPYGMGSPFGMCGGGLYAPFGMGYGSSFTLGMSYGMYGNPYGMYGNPYGMYSPYGYRPYVVPVYGYDPIQTTYGRRAIRGGAGSSFTNTTPPSLATTGTNGRTRAAGQQRTQYYDATWRNDPGNFPARSYNTGGRTSTYSPWTTPSSGTRTRSYDSFGSSPGRSMIGGALSGGAPSGGGASSGGGGRSRGRN